MVACSGLLVGYHYALSFRGGVGVCFAERLRPFPTKGLQGAYPSMGRSHSPSMAQEAGSIHTHTTAPLRRFVRN